MDGYRLTLEHSSVFVVRYPLIVGFEANSPVGAPRVRRPRHRRIVELWVGVAGALRVALPPLSVPQLHHFLADYAIRRVAYNLRIRFQPSGGEAAPRPAKGDGIRSAGMRLCLSPKSV